MELDMNVMKNRFVQKTTGYCTVYAIANMFNNDHVARYLNNPDYKGCDDVQENHLLSLIGKDFAWSEIVSIRHSYNIPLTKELVWRVLTFSNPADTHPDCDTIPYLITVRKVDTHDFHHAVTAFFKRGTLYLSDPYNENIVKCNTVDELYENFIDVWSIKRPYSVLTDGFLLIDSIALELNLS